MFNLINPSNWRAYDFAGTILGACAVIVLVLVALVPVEREGFIVNDLNGIETCELEQHIDTTVVDIMQAQACIDEFAPIGRSFLLGLATILALGAIGFAVNRIANASEIVTREIGIAAFAAAVAVAAVWTDRSNQAGEIIWNFWWRGLGSGLVVISAIVLSSKFYQRNNRDRTPVTAP